MHLRAILAAIAALCATACSSSPHELAPELGHVVMHPSVYASDREKCRMQVALGQRTHFASRIAADRAGPIADARETRHALAACLAEHGYALSRWIRDKDQKPVVLARERASRVGEAPAEARPSEPLSPSIRRDRQSSSSPVRRRRRLT